MLSTVSMWLKTKIEYEKINKIYAKPIGKYISPDSEV